MSDSVLITMVLSLKPEATQAFLENMEGMFDDTKLRNGFRAFRIDRHQSDGNKFMVSQEWASLQDYQNYIVYRTERGDTERLASALSELPQLDIWDTRVAAG